MISRRTFMRLASTTAAGAGLLSSTGWDNDWPTPHFRTASGRQHDVIVYGGTPAGIMAAIAAARAGAEVRLLLGESPLGGMVSNGLSTADVGDARVIGGLARSFYVLVGSQYGQLLTWRYEPHVAHRVFEQMLAAYGIVPVPGVLAGVIRDGARIVGLRTTGGTTWQARVFVDASYEGTLCAAAASTVYGREARSTYGEAGAGYGHAVKSYDLAMSPHACAEIPGLTRRPWSRLGAADERIMAFTYRLCVTDRADRIPFSPPPGYVADRYAALGDPALRNFQLRLYPLPNGKYDVNGGKNFLDTNFVGGNVGFCATNLAGRIQIAQAHARYQAGLLYFLATDPRVPSATRDRAASIGLAPDEFADSGHWPRQLYIREARRLVGDYVMHQSDITTHRTKHDSIGMGSYQADSHAVQRFLAGPRTVRIEGGIRRSLVDVQPYEIPYRALLPKASQAANLISALPRSVSHVVWASIRMEPQFMIAGEAAGAAAALAVAEKMPLARIGGRDFTHVLRSHGVVTHLH